MLFKFLIIVCLYGHASAFNEPVETRGHLVSPCNHCLPWLVCLFWHNLSLSLDLMVWARLIGQWAPRICPFFASSASQLWAHSTTIIGFFFLCDCWRSELSSSNLIEQETLFLLNHFLLLKLLSNFECRCVSVELFHVINENVLAIFFFKKIVFMVYGS